MSSAAPRPPPPVAAPARLLLGATRRLGGHRLLFGSKSHLLDQFLILAGGAQRELVSPHHSP